MGVINISLFSVAIQKTGTFYPILKREFGMQRCGSRAKTVFFTAENEPLAARSLA